MHLAIVGMENQFSVFLELPFYTSFTVLSKNIKRREEQTTKAVTDGLSRVLYCLLMYFGGSL